MNEEARELAEKWGCTPRTPATGTASGQRSARLMAMKIFFAGA